MAKQPKPTTEEKPVEEEVSQEPVKQTEPQTSDAEPEETEEQKKAKAVREQYPFAEKWTDEQVFDWLAKMEGRESPFVKDTQVLVYDPTRATRRSNNWETEELEAYARGQLEHVTINRRKELITALRQRRELPQAWEDSGVMTYYETGEEPAKTSTGVWAFDRTRANRPATDWETKELEAWALGEIKAVGKADSASLARELHKRLNLPGKFDGVTTTLELYKKQQKSTAENQRRAEDAKGLKRMDKSFILSTLQRYVEAVKPGTYIREDVGGQQQRLLENVFARVLRVETQHKREALDLIRNFIGEHRTTVFHSDYAYRFVHLLRGDQNVKQRHINTIRLFVTSWEEGGRQKIKQMDLHNMLKGYPADDQAILIDYFKNYV